MFNKRIIYFLLLLLLLISAVSLQAQNQYNVRKFSIYIPQGWKLYDHDVDNLVVTSTKTNFTLSFYVCDVGEEEVKWKAILRSLGKSYDFNNEISDEGGINLDHGLHVAYKFADIIQTSDDSKWKFVWAQVDNDEDYKILIFGISEPTNFGYYKSDLWKIFEYLDYKKE